MSALTVEEKITAAAARAREAAAEKYFYDAAQPFFPLGFSVIHRNPRHWDVISRITPGRASAWKHAHPGGTTSETDDERERAFRIRGEPGAVIVMDERWNPHRPFPRESMSFRSVLGAMLWICEELMIEPGGVIAPVIDAALAEQAAEHGRRGTELLEANNREVERRREAETECERLRGLLSVVKHLPRASAHMKAAYDAIAGGHEISAAEIIEQTGAPPKVVYNALGYLKRKGRIEKLAYGKYRAMPTEAPT